MKQFIIKKLNKFVLNTITFYLEDNIKEEKNFNVERLTFTLQRIKVWTIIWPFKNSKLKGIALVKKNTRVQKTIMVRGEITFNKKSSTEFKFLVGQCVICNRKKTMIRSDNTTEAEKLGQFFKNLDEKRLNVSTKMAKNVLKKPRRA